MDEPGILGVRPLWTRAPNSATGRSMNHSKPKLVGPLRAVCPVCGTTSYSRDGIHPQCAVSRADQAAPRTGEKTVKANRSGQWKKRCPRCKRELPARRMVCDCGHSFQSEMTR